MTPQRPAHRRSFFHKVHKTVCITSPKRHGVCLMLKDSDFSTLDFVRFLGILPGGMGSLIHEAMTKKKKIKFDFVSEALPCDFLSYYQHTFLVSNYSDSGSHLIFPLLAISSSNHKLIHCLITRTKHGLRLFGALGEFHFVKKKKIVPEVIELVKNQGVSNIKHAQIAALWKSGLT